MARLPIDTCSRVETSTNRMFSLSEQQRAHLMAKLMIDAAVSPGWSSCTLCPHPYTSFSWNLVENRHQRARERGRGTSKMHKPFFVHPHVCECVCECACVCARLSVYLSGCLATSVFPSVSLFPVYLSVCLPLSLRSNGPLLSANGHVFPCQLPHTSSFPLSSNSTVSRRSAHISNSDMGTSLPARRAMLLRTMQCS